MAALPAGILWQFLYCLCVADLPAVLEAVELQLPLLLQAIQELRNAIAGQVLDDESRVVRRSPLRLLSTISIGPCPTEMVENICYSLTAQAT
jgi:hypothetical protein